MLYSVAATLERVAVGSANRRLRHNVFDDRRFGVDRVLAELAAAAEYLVGSDPQTAREWMSALESGRAAEAVRTVQSDVALVRDSEKFCVRPTYSPSRGRWDKCEYRIEHCLSGIYLYGICRREDEGHEGQWIQSVEVNLEDGQSDLDHRACPTDPRMVLPHRHLHIPPWTQWSDRGMGKDSVLGLNRIHRYTGLGIGTTVYRRASNVFPLARWRSGSVSGDARALRESLHRSDPWRWESPYCPVCGRNDETSGVQWQAASRQDLADAHR